MAGISVSSAPRAAGAPGRGAPRGLALLYALGVPLLAWPALSNGYPLVFSDTGTYLSQAIHRYLGWDRPAFYSLFMLGLHWTVTTWPVVLAQAAIVVLMLERTRAAFFPAVSDAWLLGVLAVLSTMTGLPWLASRLMPDVFTPLLVLALALLILAPARLGRAGGWAMAAAAAAMTAVHQSHVLLAIGLIVVLLALRAALGLRGAGGEGLGRAGLARVLGVPAVALLALAAVNAAAHGRLSPSPFGGVFLLARVLYDGPGMRTLERECPAAGWRLCAWVGRMPASSDAFLWAADSPLNREGGAKRLAGEADAIVLATLRAEPWAQARAMLANTWEQLTRFSPNDGMHAWAETVSPWIARDFPRFEQAAYAAARQTRGEAVLPDWVERLDRAAALAGVLGALALFLRAWRAGGPGGGAAGRRGRAGLAGAVLAACLLNAAITGGLSGPHDRYQSRVIWLPAAVVLLAVAEGGQAAAARAAHAWRARVRAGGRMRRHAFA
jgi:hypothetical protein